MPGKFLYIIQADRHVRFPEKTIRSIHDLLQELSICMDLINGPIWFRGQAKKDWKLIPSLYRDVKKPEMHYVNEFKQNATLLVDPKPDDLHEWLLIMRHYEMPSRLLDWTESPLVAIFFAVYEDIEYDGVLWALLPLELNRHVTEFKNITSLPSFDKDNVILSDYIPEFVIEELPKPTLATIAPRSSSRMQAQSSVFTINHADKKPIDEIGTGQHIWKYIIPKNSKKTLRDQLNMLKITYFQLFPELNNAANEIRGKSHEN